MKGGQVPDRTTHQTNGGKDKYKSKVIALKLRRVEPTTPCYTGDTDMSMAQNRNEQKIFRGTLSIILFYFLLPIWLSVVIEYRARSPLPRQEEE